MPRVRIDAKAEKNIRQVFKFLSLCHQRRRFERRRRRQKCRFFVATVVRKDDLSLDKSNLGTTLVRTLSAKDYKHRTRFLDEMLTIEL